MARVHVEFGQVRILGSRISRSRVASEREQQAVDHRADASGGHKARGRRRGAGGGGSTGREVTALNALDRADSSVSERTARPAWQNRAKRGRHVASRIGPAACSTARSATTCVASRRVAAAYGVAHLALRTPFYVQNHDARSASTVVTRPWWAAYARGNIGAQG